MRVQIQVRLSARELAVLRQPVRGSGGFQSLLRRLARSIRDGVLTLTLTDVERIIGYAHDYGEGGFQERLGVLLEAIRKVGKVVRPL